ncbi:MAG: S41 family peptidase [Polyangiaceae bacterium]
MRRNRMDSWAWLALLAFPFGCGGANGMTSGGGSSSSRPPEKSQSQQTVVPSGDPVGQKFEGWVDAINSGDRARIAKFWSGTKDAEHRTEMDVTLMQRTGGFDVHHVEDATGSEMVALLKGRKSERWQCLHFEVDAEAPNDVESILLRPANAPTKTDDAGTPPLEDKTRRQVIQAFIRELHRAYVYPDKAEAMDRELGKRQREHAYDAIASRIALARALTADVQRLTHDKHLRVEVGCGKAGRPAQEAPSPAGSTADKRRVFGSTKRLDGNVAYIDIATFGIQRDAARDEIRETMESAADAAAIIFDVRHNGGGEPETVALVTSYVFGTEPVHLNSLYWRISDRTEDFFTDPKVAGAKFGPTKPIFVLTSTRTFSAAEEFTYNLQTQKRATIVGETTGGGAHPGDFVSLPQGFMAFVPNGRAINPITKTNWEGTGVKPDVAAPAEKALETAHQLALEQLKKAP